MDLDLFTRKGALYLGEWYYHHIQPFSVEQPQARNFLCLFSGSGNWAKAWQVGGSGKQEFCPSLSGCVIGQGGLTSLVLSFCHLKSEVRTPCLPPRMR